MITSIFRGEPQRNQDSHQRDENRLS
jgi:hypothetical protein